MFEPDMQPGSASRAGRKASVRRAEGARSRGLPVGDWKDPQARLDELYRWTETSALRCVDWYLADRARKRRAARLLRLGTAAGVAAGAVLPLLELVSVLPAAGSAWGFVALLAAAACACADRYFGLTAGWMRDVAAAQAVQRRLETLQFDWATEEVRELPGSGGELAYETADRCLALLRRFRADIAELVRGETAAWMAEFGSPPELAGHEPARAVPVSPCPERHVPPHGDAPVPPAHRWPQMPRQRPPEGSG